MQLLFALFVMFLAFPGVAQAVMPPDPSTDTAAFLQLVIELWKGAAWAPLIAVVVYGAVLLLTKFGGSLLPPFFGTRWGKLLLACALAVSGAVFQGLMSGDSLQQIIVTALTAAVGAVGLHSGVKNAVQSNK